MSIIYFGIAIFIFGTVMPMDPTFKRPECAKEIENKKFGNHYQTVNLANNAENSFNTIDNDEVRIINFEHMEFDVSSIGRELPNETYMSVVSEGSDCTIVSITKIFDIFYSQFSA